MDSFFNLLPTFKHPNNSNSSHLEELSHLKQLFLAVDHRLTLLEKRFHHDSLFKDDRLQGVEAELTSRISLLEMQLS